MKLSFFGATEGVTGSNFFLETAKTKILVDCGLFQGGEDQERKNWDQLPYDPSQIDYLVVTHSHIDHVGRLPLLCKLGFRGKVIATEPVRAFSEIFLADTCHLLENTARYLGAEQLYSAEDVGRAIALFETHKYYELIKAGDAEIILRDAGHILGSAIAEIKAEGKTIIFSGDLGNPPVPILRDTDLITKADYVVMESTYGNRNHAPSDQRKLKLERAVEQTRDRNGTLLMPSFAMERTQEILYELDELRISKQIPDLPIYLDSPLAIKATKIYERYSDYFDDEAKKMLAGGKNFFDFKGLKFCREAEESKQLDRDQSPKVIMAGSGMSNGGRIVFHEQKYLPLDTTILLIVGFQVKGTLGRRLVEGERQVKIHGELVDVRATVDSIDSYSAHADQKKLIHWLSKIAQPIQKIFLVHGEDEAKTVLSQKVKGDLKLEAVIPKENEEFKM